MNSEREPREFMLSACPNDDDDDDYNLRCCYFVLPQCSVQNQELFYYSTFNEKLTFKKKSYPLIGLIHDVLGKKN